MQNQMYFGRVHQESLRQVLEFYYDDEKKALYGIRPK